MYQQVYSDTEKKISTFHIRRLSDGAIVPFDPDNTDYQAYLKFLEDGGTPTPADGE
jgi:hypothetical protein